MPIIQIDSCTSTNSYIRKLFDEGKVQEGDLLVAHEQTAGRGQAGNAWESAPGKNLTFSFVLSPTFLHNNFFLASMTVSLAVHDMLNRHTEQLTIKWPNDIYCGDKKIAGILIENSFIGRSLQHAIVGIGININQMLFRSDAPNPISLKQASGQKTDYDLFHLAEVYQSCLNCRYDTLTNDPAAIVADYHDRLYRKSGYHCFSDQAGSFRACIRNVSEDGMLRLTDTKGHDRSYYFKEVSFVME